MTDQNHDTGHDHQATEIPAEKARQGMTGVHVRHVLAASFVGAVVAVGVVYAITV